MLDHFAYFSLASIVHGSDFLESTLKGLVNRFRGSLKARGLKCDDDIFGSSTDLWAFSVDVDGVAISVGLSPERGADNSRWCAQIQSDDLGWFQGTRAKRMEQVKRVEWAVHEALKADLHAKDIKWHVYRGPIRPEDGQDTP